MLYNLLDGLTCDLEGRPIALDNSQSKKRAQATGPAHKKVYKIKGGQFLLSYPIFISLLLQLNEKRVKFYFFNFISSFNSSI
ncbi:hypothetical protein AM1BK_10840 [Neobacillus kokaensis]|uniref:Uncharacterized protein n=1 Tax=Neobacillus kokaensis TaxID=2759023 RepID=A0ABQ3N8F8_9BACI|nr:hypothetical protein AM1BK_10840 [Neobacillus kokaensis]